MNKKTLKSRSHGREIDTLQSVSQLSTHIMWENIKYYKPLGQGQW